MGIRNILDDNTIIFVSNGNKKTHAIKSVISGVVDKNVTPSALNNYKGKVYAIVNKEAASKL